MWPYTQGVTINLRGKTYYSMFLNNEKMLEVVYSPVLSRKLYCFIAGWPRWTDLTCYLGSHDAYKQGVRQQPLNMLKDNIPISVLNAVFAVMALVFGVFGELL